MTGVGKNLAKFGYSYTSQRVNSELDYSLSQTEPACRQVTDCYKIAVASHFYTTTFFWLQPFVFITSSLRRITFIGKPMGIFFQVLLRETLGTIWTLLYFFLSLEQNQKSLILSLAKYDLISIFLFRVLF